MGSSLAGKVAIVTGAARGIGRAHALALAAEGASVIVNDLGGDPTGRGADLLPAQEVVEEIRATGGTADVNGDDVADWQGAERLVRQAINAFGGLHILVNNAGIVRDRMTFSMSEAEWDDVVRVHLRGHIAPLHAAAGYWRDQAKTGASTSGRVINTTSESGLFGNPGQSNYAAAKAGIASLTLVAARELQRYGVTVNAIAPRARTRMTEALFDMDATVDGHDEWAPGNVAPFVAYLASDGAAHINGQVFIVGGGTVHRLGGWHVAGRIATTGRWTVEGLAQASPELFGDDSPAVGPVVAPDAEGLAGSAR